MAPPLLRNVAASVELYSSGDQPKVLCPKALWTWAFKRQAEAFVDCVLNGTESLNSGADAIEDLRLIEKMWRVQVEKNTAKEFAAR
jgi:predicted dehydrogenase